jgi:hypothetical protein
MPTISPDLILPDDTPNPVQLKISPIGQIVKSGAAAAAAKKKSAAPRLLSKEALRALSGHRVPNNPGPDSMAAKKKKMLQVQVLGLGMGAKRNQMVLDRLPRQFLEVKEDRYCLPSLLRAHNFICWDLRAFVIYLILSRLRIPAAL